MISAILIQSIDYKIYSMSIKILNDYEEYVIKPKIFDILSTHFLNPTKYEAKIHLLKQVNLSKNQKTEMIKIISKAVK